MSKGNAVQAAKARIVTLEAELAKANNTIIAQRTALAGLRLDAITNADETEARLKTLTSVVDEYNRDLVQAENELATVTAHLAEARATAKAMGRLVKYIILFASLCLVTGSIIYGVL